MGVPFDPSILPRPAPFGFKYYGKRNIYDNYKKQPLRENENNL